MGTVKETIEKAIKKAIEYHSELGEKLEDLDNPYEAIANHLPYGVGYGDLFPEIDTDNSIEFGERVESEIDTIWSNL